MEIPEEEEKKLETKENADNDVSLEEEKTEDTQQLSKEADV